MKYVDEKEKKFLKQKKKEDYEWKNYVNCLNNFQQDERIRCYTVELESVELLRGDILGYWPTVYQNSRVQDKYYDYNAISLFYVLI